MTTGIISANPFISPGENKLVNAMSLPGFIKDVRQRRFLKRQVLKALCNDEFELWYQPQTDLAGSRIIGVEALLRWCSSEIGIIAPADFIPVAEKLGLITEIGNLVIEKACGQLAEWQQKFNCNIRMAVNVSYMQVHSEDIVHVVDACMSHHGIPADMLEIELTETSLVADKPKVINILHQLREIGARIAIDDFGTGYSSLSHLASMPFDMVKIDRSFIANLGITDAHTTITEAIIKLGKQLDMEVLAEGVETDHQRYILERINCDYMQGNLFSRPVPGDMLPLVTGLDLS